MIGDGVLHRTGDFFRLVGFDPQHLCKEMQQRFVLLGNGSGNFTALIRKGHRGIGCIIDQFLFRQRLQRTGYRCGADFHPPGNLLRARLPFVPRKKIDRFQIVFQAGTEFRRFHAPFFTKDAEVGSTQPRNYFGGR